MKYIYASLTGNVASLINKLNLEAIDLNTIDHFDEDYILFTYTAGDGEIPYEVESFLETSSAHLKGVIVSGDQAYGDQFGAAGDLIANMYNVPLLYKPAN